MKIKRFIPENLRDVEIIKITSDLLENFVDATVKVIGEREWDEEFGSKLKIQTPQIKNYYLQSFGSKGFYLALGNLTDPTFTVKEWYEYPENLVDRCCVVIEVDRAGRTEEEVDEFVAQAWQSLKHLCLKCYLLLYNLNYEDIISGTANEEFWVETDQSFVDSFFNNFYPKCEDPGAIVGLSNVGEFEVGKYCCQSNPRIGLTQVGKFLIGEECYYWPIQDEFWSETDNNFTDTLKADLNPSVIGYFYVGKATVSGSSSSISDAYYSNLIAYPEDNLEFKANSKLETIADNSYCESIGQSFLGNYSLVGCNNRIGNFKVGELTTETYPLKDKLTTSQETFAEDVLSSDLNGMFVGATTVGSSYISSNKSGISDVLTIQEV